MECPRTIRSWCHRNVFRIDLENNWLGQSCDLIKANLPRCLRHGVLQPDVDFHAINRHRVIKFYRVMVPFVRVRGLKWSRKPVRLEKSNLMLYIKQNKYFRGRLDPKRDSVSIDRLCEEFCCFYKLGRVKLVGQMRAMPLIAFT